MTAEQTRQRNPLTTILSAVLGVTADRAADPRTKAPNWKPILATPTRNLSCVHTKPNQHIPPRQESH